MPYGSHGFRADGVAALAGFLTCGALRVSPAPQCGDPWLTRASRIAFLLLLLSPRLASAQPRPLLWAADLDGGVPYVFLDDKENLVGFEVDLKDALARELARPIEFKQYQFDNLFAGLDRGDFDFAMNGLEITADRQ